MAHRSKSSSAMQITLTLPRPHEAQQQILDRHARFNVEVCGRRFGKTMLDIHEASPVLLAGQPVGCFFPTYKMLAETWRQFVDVFSPVRKAKNEQEHRIELITGGVLEMWYNMGMPSHKPCPICGKPMSRQSPRCRQCWRDDPIWKQNLSVAHKGKATYQRTPKLNEQMSDRTTGIRRPGWKPASATHEVAEKIRQWWTPERREAARLRGLEFAKDQEWRLRCGLPGEMNPMWEDGRTVIPYARGWSRKVKQLAWERAEYRCEICQSDMPHDTHHKDFHKDNHDLDNLQVLCRKCHKALHVAHLKGVASHPEA